MATASKWRNFIAAWIYESIFKMKLPFDRSRAVGPLRVCVFILALVPLLSLVWAGLHDQLGTNPIERVTHRTGEWALRFLLLTLTITPARRLLNWPQLLRLRRMLGLYAFFYASLHFLTYLVVDQFFDFHEIARDVVKRPFITVGFFAFVLLVPLAVTSTNGMMRRLGKRWQQLHRLVYVIAIAAVLHFWWLVKADVREPLIYGALLSLLLLYRLWHARRAPVLQALRSSS